jgi:hypothetical protein
LKQNCEKAQIETCLGPQWLCSEAEVIRAPELAFQMQRTSQLPHGEQGQLQTEPNIWSDIVKKPKFKFTCGCGGFAVKYR